MNHGSRDFIDYQGYYSDIKLCQYVRRIISSAENAAVSGIAEMVCYHQTCIMVLIVSA
jgi:hypothetical protein